MRHRLPLGLLVTLVLCGDATLLVFGAGSTSAARRAAPAATTTTVTSTAGATPGSGVDPDAAGVVRPPTPGLYRYRNTAATPDVAPVEWSERVSSVSADSGTTRLHVRATTGIDQTLDFSPGAVTQITYSQVGTSIADEVTCDAGSVVLLSLPLRADATWVSRSSCTNLLGDSLIDQRTTRVIGQTNRVVGAVTVPVWELVVVSVQTLTPAKGGTSRAQSTTTTLDVAASRGLTVRQVVQRGSNPATIHVDQLLALDPA